MGTLLEDLERHGLDHLNALCVCGHARGDHGPWPFEADKSMRCHRCSLNDAGWIKDGRCTCGEYAAA